MSRTLALCLDRLRLPVVQTSLVCRHASTLSLAFPWSLQHPLSGAESESPSLFAPEPFARPRSPQPRSRPSLAPAPVAPLARPPVQPAGSLSESSTAQSSAVDSELTAALLELPASFMPAVQALTNSTLQDLTQLEPKTCRELLNGKWYMSPLPSSTKVDYGSVMVNVVMDRQNLGWTRLKVDEELLLKVCERQQSDLDHVWKSLLSEPSSESSSESADRPSSSSHCDVGVMRWTGGVQGGLVVQIVFIYDRRTMRSSDSGL
ncbi:uncharacterized protein BJ171DRAFT_485600 [Polychytrium aggregatum]|uniref:uncharacterized protein n=1 Tax=Polychytrium aggregatum TaxID=110093 RepID=UPI0022FE9B86|nr:uncharacterized protein BJ171DRAFT_485600 [Polychytrium aggregatum]KAI9209932.1 hypothetical protein BJ171DRAFT_485600 [Polychytrium aggregatum]